MASPTTDRRLGLVGNTAYKAPATVVATANITLSGEQTIDGVACKAINAAGRPDRVLATAQTDGTQNGLWDVSTASWTRSFDADGNYDIVNGTQVQISQGTNARSVYVLTTPDPITVGTTVQTWVASPSVGFLAALAGIAGTTLIGWLRNAAGAVATTLYRLLGWQAYNPMEFMTDAQRADVEASTALLDVSAAINAAITAAGSGGVVELPPYPMLCTSPILAENKRGLTIRGKKGQYGFNGTRIVATHTGKAALSLVGSLFCRLDGFTIEGAAASKPKTGLLLGRSSAASAGNHTFIDVNVQGYYQEIGTAIIASEENTWINCYLVPNAARVAGVLISPADGQTLNGSVVTIGGLTSSSMECNTFIGGTIGNSDNTAGTTGLYIDCGASTGHHHIHGTFFVKNGGDSFIFIRLGSIDGLDTEFPIGFHDCCGEIGAGAPTNGLHISSGTTRILSGFTAQNLRLQTPATNNILCDGGGSVYLIGPRISTPYRASGNKPSTFNRIDGGDLSLLSESAITITTLTSSRLIHNTAGPTITTSTSNVVLDMAGTKYAIPPITSALVEKRTAPTYGATVSVDASLGNEFDVSVSNGTAFTVAAPTNPVDGQRITIKLQNNSGGAMGAVTWNAAYKLAAWTSPATGFSRSIDFRYNSANWVEIGRTTVDVPN